MDIEFWRSLDNFHDKSYSDVAKNAFENHLWYLNQHNIGMAFYDKEVSNEEKLAMVIALSKKAIFIDLPKSRARKVLKTETLSNKAESISRKSSLSSFVTEATMQFFDILNIGSNFLKLHPSEWETDPEYQEGRRRVASLHVTNDVAERAVKLATDFNQNLTKDPVQQEFLLQVVEKHREEYRHRY